MGVPVPDMPESIQVGPHRYTVEATGAAITKARAREGPTVVGHHDANALVLTVDPDLPHSQQADTVLHEVMHAVLYSVDVDRVLVNHEAGLDEHLICAVTPILLDTLRRNPDLVAFLITDDL